MAFNRGRPRKDKTLCNIVKVRLDDDDFAQLLYHANERGDTYSEIVRKALRLYYRNQRK